MSEDIATGGYFNYNIRNEIKNNNIMIKRAQFCALFMKISIISHISKKKDEICKKTCKKY